MTITPRPAWDDYFLEIARTVAKRSTCRRIPAGVGALLVRDRQILSTGYAGSIRGQPHCTDHDVGCLIDEKTGGCVRTVHAEMNAILQAAQHGVAVGSGAQLTTLYTTLSPCWDCFKMAVNAGVRRIVYAVEYRIVDRQQKFAAELGIEFVHVGTEKYVPAPQAAVVSLPVPPPELPTLRTYLHGAASRGELCTVCGKAFPTEAEVRQYNYSGGEHLCWVRTPACLEAARKAAC